MAAGVGRSGHQSPSALNRTIERVFEDAQHTGEVDLCSRKLKEFPKIASKYDLSDTILTDISKNRFPEIPTTACQYLSTECLNCYHNAIRCLPDAIIQLQSLTHLNLSRNQLSNIPPFICQLQVLEVLIASNNRLVSLPEEIGRLERLMELDVSSNEITHLPVQIGDLGALRILNVRRNLLVELPVEIGRLCLTRLDFLGNKIQKIPTEYRFLESLEELILDHNPLISPPAHICTKGLVHIMKYLQTDAIKEDTKRGLINNDTDMRRYRRPSSFRQSSADGYVYQAPQVIDTRRKNRHLVVSGDSGYNTTDDKNRWSPDVSVLEDANRLKKNDKPFSPDVHPCDSPDNLSWDHEIPDMSLADDFNRELARQQMKYMANEQDHHRNMQPRIEEQAWREKQLQTEQEARQRAEDERRRVETEERRRAEQEEKRLEEMERDERRRASIRVQEEQKALLERQRNSDSQINSFVHPSSHTFNYIDSHEEPPTDEHKKSPTNDRYREEYSRQPQGSNYRRTASDSQMTYTESSKADPREEFFRSMHNNRNGNVEFQNVSPTSPTFASQRSPGLYNNPEDEFRHRHQTIRDQQRHEAQLAARRFEEEKQRIKHIQKSAVYNFINKRTSSSSIHSMEGEEYNKDLSPSNSPLYSDNQTKVPGFHTGGQKPLEHPPLNFTIRREMQHMREEVQLLANLRENIESRLKVKLPDDLPGALKDGVVLCHLANHIRPRSISSIHVPSPAVPKLTMAKCRRNVENFLEICANIGVDQVELCAPSDILEERGLVRIANTVQALLHNSAHPKQSTV